MDLSLYYNKLQSIYNFSIIVFFFTLCTVLFIVIRTFRDKRETVKEKILCCVLLTAILSLVISALFLGPVPYKKDIDQGTIYGYEGNFEIVETTHGIYNKVIFIIDGEEICLKYFEDDGYDFDALQPGEYDGRIIYAHHASKVLDIEIYSSK